MIQPWNWGDTGYQVKNTGAPGFMFRQGIRDTTTNKVVRGQRGDGEMGSETQSLGKTGAGTLRHGYRIAQG